ncbi:MAG: hypothetical protein FWC71_06555 [Defluviitaleaceae bacterium]|nr:hypothetical protein [Defluviitaleaceae bacterium]
MQEQTLTDFIKEHNIRAMWDETSLKWWFSAIDLCAALRGCDYLTARNYYHWWKHKRAADDNQAISTTNSLKFEAPNGKRHYTTAVDTDGALRMIQTLPGARADALRLSLVASMQRDDAVLAQFDQLGTANRDQPQAEMHLQTVTKQPIV